MVRIGTKKVFYFNDNKATYGTIYTDDMKSAAAFFHFDDDKKYPKVGDVVKMINDNGDELNLKVREIIHSSFLSDPSQVLIFLGDDRINFSNVNNEQLFRIILKLIDDSRPR